MIRSVPILSEKGVDNAMKTIVRFVIAVVILLSFASVSGNEVAWAAPSTSGTVPPLKDGCDRVGSGGGVLNTGTSIVYLGSDVVPGGGSATACAILPDDLYALGNPQGKTKFLGAGVSVVVYDAQANPLTILPAAMTVCFPNPLGYGQIHRYWPELDWASSWVPFPTYISADGLTCTVTFLPGIYAVIG